MELIRPSEVAPQGDSNPLFLGSVTRQVLVGSSNSNDYTMAVDQLCPRCPEQVPPPHA